MVRNYEQQKRQKGWLYQLILLSGGAGKQNLFYKRCACYAVRILLRVSQGRRHVPFFNIFSVLKVQKLSETPETYRKCKRAALLDFQCCDTVRQNFSTFSVTPLFALLKFYHRKDKQRQLCSELVLVSFHQFSKP